MTSASQINLSCRCEPFARSKWVADFLPFPFKESTYAEFTESEQLYDIVGAYIVRECKNGQSYKFKPKQSQSKATRILENLARCDIRINAFCFLETNTIQTRIAKLESNALGDDEKKQIEAENEERLKKESEKVNVLLGLGLHQFTFDDTAFYAIHQAIGDPVGGDRCYPAIYKSLVVFVEGCGRLETLKKFVNAVLESNESQKDSLFFKIYRYACISTRTYICHE